MLAALFAAAVAAAPAPPPPPVGDWLPLDPANTLVVDTSKGRFVVELRPDLAPLHVARMKLLARQGYYTNARFYRVIKGFMAQTGKLVQSPLPNLKDEFTFARTPSLGFTAAGGPGQGFVGATPVQIDPATGRGFAFFCPGIASTAHGAPANTGANQVFFMRGRGGPSIEAHFTAWGRVIHGQEVIDGVQDGEPPPKPDTVTRMRVMGDMPAAERPKLMVMDTRGPAFAELVAGVMKERREVYHPCDVTVPVREE